MNQKWLFVAFVALFSTPVLAEQWNISFRKITIEESRKDEKETYADVGFVCDGIKDVSTEALVRAYNSKTTSANTYSFIDDHGTPVIPGWTIEEKYFKNCSAYVEVEGYGIRGKTLLTECHDKLQKDSTQKTCDFSASDEGVVVDGRLRIIK